MNTGLLFFAVVLAVLIVAAIAEPWHTARRRVERGREQGFFDPPPDEPGDFDWPQWQGPAR